MVLPCIHKERITRQVRPTIDLLTNLDEWHPDVLLQHNIAPKDYKGALVFRSAIESIRGTFIDSSTVGREGFVRGILEELTTLRRIASYEHSGNRNRHDFTVAVTRDPDYFAAIEVKGGEGNSINISERPLWAREFGVWCHLDGAIINSPAHGAKAIIGRLTNELVSRRKHVDVLFFRDVLCGTSVRPCPKYPIRPGDKGTRIAPDVFLFPQRIPQESDPEPPVHTLETLKLPRLVLEMFGVPRDQEAAHIWQVHVSFRRASEERVAREVRIVHRGENVGPGRS